MSSVTAPVTATGPPATVTRSGAGSPGPSAPGPASAIRIGDRCTATGRFPAGAGPLPCSQYRVNTGWTGSASGAEPAAPPVTGSGPGSFAVAAARVTIPATGTGTRARPAVRP